MISKIPERPKIRPWFDPWLAERRRPPYLFLRNQGGQLRLVNLNKRVNDLLQMTRLSSVFDVERDEASAIKSLGGDAPSRAVA